MLNLLPNPARALGTEPVHPWTKSPILAVGGSGSQSGQDLLALKRWVNQRNDNDDDNDDIKRIAVDYFGGGSPRYELGTRAESWWSSRGNPKTQGIEWLAVSVNSLQSSVQPAAPGFNRKPEDEYSWLTATRPKPSGPGALPEPDYRAGTSIFIYRL